MHIDRSYMLYIYIYKNACQPFAAVSQLPAALRRSPKVMPLICLNTRIINLVNFHRLEGPWIFCREVGDLFK